MGAVEDEVRKWRYFVKSIFPRNLSVKEKDEAAAKGSNKIFGAFFFSS